MKPNLFVENLREYPAVSHRAWEHKDKRSVLKLDWNEADVTLPTRVKRAVTDFVITGPINWYPDVANKLLTARIAAYVRLPASHVQYFVGEDCALECAVRTFVSAGEEVVLVAPTYDNFRVFVESVGARPVYVFTKDIFKPDIHALMRGITARTRMVYLANPNNPTGVLYTARNVEKLLTSFPRTLFVIDEAYAEFAGQSVAPLVKKYSNIIVGRSFSKAFGLASFRLGYILANPDVLASINKIRNGKSISALAQVAALASLQDHSYVVRYVKKVRAARNFVCRELRHLGCDVRETPANFVLLKVHDPHALSSALRKHNVFVRTMNHLPHMENYVRITVGTKQTMKRLISIMRVLLLQDVS